MEIIYLLKLLIVTCGPLIFHQSIWSLLPFNSSLRNTDGRFLNKMFPTWPCWKHFEKMPQTVLLLSYHSFFATFLSQFFKQGGYFLSSMTAFLPPYTQWGEKLANTNQTAYFRIWFFTAKECQNARIYCFFPKYTDKRNTEKREWGGGGFETFLS